ncbi:MAG: preprotein translocase subunit SecG [Clostridia bacterium]|jgi:preprotein translocase subunit SecG|nr:preprotein translocase subunit SecG [Clostridia bacterium]
MLWYEILIGAILVVTSIALVAIVLMQEGRSDGLSGAIAGGAETFFGKNKGRTMEEKLVKITKVLAVIFFVLSLVATLVVLFVK